MNYIGIKHFLDTGNIEDPFDIYEAFVRNTSGSPEEQVAVWSNHIGIDYVLDMQLKTAIAVRRLCDMQREKACIEDELQTLWNTMIKPQRRSARLNGKRVQVKFK